MERAEQPPKRENLKSYDLLASVDMMRFDIERIGYVLPETRQRVYDEELSSIAEGCNRASRTEFTLQRKGSELQYFDRGEAKSYMAMLLTGRNTAECEKILDHRRSFLHDWAVRDLRKGYEMQALRPGQKMAWYNAYPKQIENVYGADFMRECGLFPEREMGFLYVAACNQDGSVTLESQTVDRSDKAAFEAAMLKTDFDEDYDMETLVRTYDGMLTQKYGGKFYAGRRGSEWGENAWEDITRHHDLISFFLDGLERLAASNMSRQNLERATKQHIIGVWKAFKNRLTNGQAPSMPGMPYELLNYDERAVHARLALETQNAYHQARVEGDVKIGCGGVAKADGEPLDLVDGQATFDSIFGKNSSAENYKFDKYMFCVGCQAPPSETEKKTQSKKMCGPCGYCRGCDKVLRAKSKGAFALAA